jgi:hypothetical protein
VADDTIEMAYPDVISPDAEQEATNAPHGRDSEGNPLAPYGLKVDGTPRRTASGRRAGSGVLGGVRHGESRTRRRAKKRTAQKAAAPRPARPKPSTPVDYSELLSAGVGMLGAGMSKLGRAITAKRPQLRSAVMADGIAFQAHADSLGKALNEAAGREPAFAAWLDRLNSASPWAGVAFASLPLLAQVLVNHDIVTPGMLGTLPREQLRAWAEQMLNQAGYTVAPPPEQAPPAPQASAA